MIPVIPPTAQRKDYARLLSNTINALVRAVNQSGTSVTRGEVIFPPKAEPISPVEGQTYMDSTTHKLRTYDGTIWQDHW